MSRRKGGITYVPDFSTFVGTGTRTVTATWSNKIMPDGFEAFTTESVIVGQRFKSAPVKGSIDPITGIKLATNYSRIIHTIGNPNESFEFQVPASRGRVRRYRTDSPATAIGIFLNDGGLFSTTSGVVNVSQDYVNRAEAEAYEDLLQQKINLAQAAAELGETLAWLANLVRRLIETILIVRDALRGKIRRAAAHRAIYGNVNRVLPNTRIANNRWKEAAHSGLGPQSIAWRREASRKWWNDEAYSRFLAAEQRRARASLASRRSSSRTKKASSAWLEYQYALMPLIYDIYGALEALKEGVRRPAVFSVQRTVGGPVNPERLVSSVSGLHQASGSVRQSCRVVYVGQLETSALAAASELGLLNPWLVMWELVPFSFVVDWILPIGKVLQSFTAPIGVRFVDGYRDKVVHGIFDASIVDRNVIIGSPPKAKVKCMAFQRGRYVGWPLTGAYFRSPFSYPHVINAIALLAQLSKK